MFYKVLYTECFPVLCTEAIYTHGRGRGRKGVGAGIGLEPFNWIRLYPLLRNVGIVEVPRGEKMLYSGTDPELYITEYTLVYEDYMEPFNWSSLYPLLRNVVLNFSKVYVHTAGDAAEQEWVLEVDVPPDQVARE